MVASYTFILKCSKLELQQHWLRLIEIVNVAFHDDAPFKNNSLASVCFLKKHINAAVKFVIFNHLFMRLHLDTDLYLCFPDD